MPAIARAPIRRSIGNRRSPLSGAISGTSVPGSCAMGAGAKLTSTPAASGRCAQRRLLAAIGDGLLGSLDELGADPGLPLFVDRLRRFLERLELLGRQLGNGYAELPDLLQLRGILGRHALARHLDAVLAGLHSRLPDYLLILGREALPDLLVDGEDQRIGHVVPQRHVLLA